MALDANKTRPGRIYRRTRDASPGTYFIRPWLDATALMARLRRKGAPMSREIYLVNQFKRDPTLVLMQCHLRGTDPFTRQRFETKTYMLIPRDYRFREVQQKPSYTSL